MVTFVLLVISAVLLMDPVVLPVVLVVQLMGSDVLFVLLASALM